MTTARTSRPTGRQITDAERREQGQVLAKAWLSPEDATDFAAVVEAYGGNKSAAITAAIKTEAARLGRQKKSTDG